MGTNYYLHKNTCDHCGRSDERIHIGKSSGGWCFALHVGDDIGINSLENWKAEWKTGVIKNEYDDVLDSVAMLEVIEDREPYALRHSPHDGHCIGHGDTYDLIRGDFS